MFYQLDLDVALCQEQSYCTPAARKLFDCENRLMIICDGRIIKNDHQRSSYIERNSWWFFLEYSVYTLFVDMSTNCLMIKSTQFKRSTMSNVWLLWIGPNVIFRALIMFWILLQIDRLCFILIIIIQIHNKEWIWISSSMKLVSMFFLQIACLIFVYQRFSNFFQSKTHSLDNSFFSHMNKWYIWFLFFFENFDFDFYLTGNLKKKKLDWKITKKILVIRKIYWVCVQQVCVIMKKFFFCCFNFFEYFFFIVVNNKQKKKSHLCVFCSFVCLFFLVKGY